MRDAIQIHYPETSILDVGSAKAGTVALRRVGRSMHIGEEMKNHLIQETDAQLHLELSLQSYLLLNAVMTSLEASSYSEVIRRALQLGERYWTEDIISSGNEIGSKNAHAATKRLHVRIPHKTKERLDRLKEARGGTYSDVLTKSVLVLAQLIRNTDRAVNNEPSSLRQRDEIVHLLGEIA